MELVTHRTPPQPGLPTLPAIVSAATAFLLLLAGSALVLAGTWAAALGVSFVQLPAGALMILVAIPIARTRPGARPD